MNTYESIIEIQNKKIGMDFPTYFIADIAANHDGDLGRAKELIYAAAEAGADAAKFQHFTAETIVSDHGFKNLGVKQSHQKSWGKSVFDVYKDASVSLSWTNIIKETCDKAGIAFFTSPYSMDIVDHIDPFVPAYKVGSGDITWLDMIEHIARKDKPIILASGASTMDDVERAVSAAMRINPMICLMQCNTNYTASLENFKHIQLNVIKSYSAMYPGMIIGLSDHTLGCTTVLGAIALGARVIEKHFTDDTTRTGPDHAFSMTPDAWRDMVDRARELENALGTGVKRIEDNEKDTVVLQRRAIRTKNSIGCHTELTRDNLTMLRPCPKDAIPLHFINEVIGKCTRRNIESGDYLRWTDIE